MSKPTKKDRRIAELEAEVEKLRALTDPEVSFRDLEMKMADGSLDLRAHFGEDSRPALKFLAAVMLHAALGEGEFEEEPPNYAAVEMSLTPAGTFQPIRAALEVIKPGGKSSHEIRRELEAQLTAARPLTSEDS